MNNIYVYMPNFFNNFKINNFLFQFTKKYKSLLKYNLFIVGAHGNYPYNYWNGSLSVNEGQLQLYKDYCDFINSTMFPIILDYSNLNLCIEDYQNCYNNLLLNLHNDISTEIILCDIGLKHYIENKYKNYKFIFSANGDIKNPITPDIIQRLIKEENFDKIILPYYYREDFNTLEALNNKNKILIPLNSYCGQCNIEKQKECITIENQLQYNFYSKSQIKQCSLKNSIEFQKRVNIDDYIHRGFSSFIFNSIIPSTYEIYNFLILFVDLFVKNDEKINALKILSEALI